jgi:hypothetical protein
MIKNDENTYKIYITYPDNYLSGDYSFVVTNQNGNLATKDYRIKNMNAWQKITRFVSNMFNNLFGLH